MQLVATSLVLWSKAGRSFLLCTTTILVLHSFLLSKLIFLFSTPFKNLVDWKVDYTLSSSNIWECQKQLSGKILFEWKDLLVERVWRRKRKDDDDDDGPFFSVWNSRKKALINSPSFSQKVLFISWYPWHGFVYFEDMILCHFLGVIQGWFCLEFIFKSVLN